MQYLLAIDAGTSSVRAVIFDTNARQISDHQLEWFHKAERGVAGSMSFDCRANWQLICECIKQAIAKGALASSDILALSATSMREGIVLYDKNGEELWAVANVDARADKEVKHLKEHFGNIEEEFYQTSGQTFALGAIPRLLWVKNNLPEIYEKTARMSMLSDWVLHKLSGEITSEPSNAGTSGIFSLKNRDWEPSMLAKVGLKDDILPPCFECSTVIGTVTQKASSETTLATNTKVVTGGGDVQLGSAGLGVVDVGQIAVLGGSFWQQVVNIDKNTLPPLNMDIRVNPNVIAGQSQAEGITFFSGLVMRWFKNVFCALEREEAKRRNIDIYTLLEEKAKSVAVGSNGIVPIFSDSMKYGKWYHASPSFLGLSLDEDKCNIGALFRSLQENACIVSLINLEKIKSFSGVEFSQIVFAGGASKGTLWSQILSDVTNCTVKIPQVTEATALGAAMSAGVGAGIYSSLQEAGKELVVWEREYTPNTQHHNKYQDIKEQWQEVYKEQLKLVDRDLLSSMWKAPGL